MGFALRDSLRSYYAFSTECLILYHSNANTARKHESALVLEVQLHSSCDSHSNDNDISTFFIHSIIIGEEKTQFFE